MESENLDKKEYKKVDPFYGLKFGSLILANRYNNFFDNHEIPDGHKIGPYVVLGREGNFLQCLYATSVLKTQNVRDSYLYIAKDETIFLEKDTYLDACRIRNISASGIVNCVGQLENNVTKKISKKLEILKRRGIYSLRYVFPIKVPFEVLDVIWYQNGIYLLIQETQNGFNAIELKDKEDGKCNFKVSINGLTYYYDISKIELLTNLDGAVRINFIEDYNVLANLLSKIDVFLKKQEEIKRVKRGSLIEYNNTLYYVYGENGEFWQVLEVTKIEEDGLAKIFIGNGIYFIDFQNCGELKKKDVQDTGISFASEDEMDKIKKLKKELTNKMKSSSNKLVKTKFNTGDIVKDLATKNEECLVLVSTNQYVIVVRKEDIYTRNYKPFKINPNLYFRTEILDRILLRDILAEVRNADLAIKNEDIKRLIKELDGNTLPKK